MWPRTRLRMSGGILGIQNSGKELGGLKVRLVRLPAGQLPKHGTRGMAACIW